MPRAAWLDFDAAGNRPRGVPSMKCLARTLLVVSLVLPLPALAADPDPAVLVDNGHFKQARAVLEKRLGANPRDAAALVLMARVRLAFQDADAATTLAQRALGVDPKNSSAHVILADAIGRRINDAGTFGKMRLAGQIRSELAEALALDPKNVDAMEGLLSFYLQAPGIAGGSRDKAVELADRIMSLDPVRGCFAKVAIADHDKKPEQYEGLSLKAVEANPTSYAANARMATLYASDRWKDSDKSVRYAQRSLQLDSTRVSAYVTLATVYASREQWPELDQLLERAEKEVPDNYQPHYTAGRIALLNGKDLPRAERYLRRYLTQREAEGGAQSLAAAHWRLGQALEKEGRKREALEEIQTAVGMKGLTKQVLEEARKDLKRLGG
jgi:tetratricopeptide (TPR) repeat protein